MRFHHDVQTATLVGQIAAVPQVPETWGLMIGDAVHNYRAALDHLMWGLVSSAGIGEPRERTQFPICTTWQSWASDTTAYSLDQFPEPVQPEIVALMDDLQPYKAGDEANQCPLAWLVRLDNTDKHRALQPAIPSVHEVRIGPPDPVEVGLASAYQTFADVPMDVGTEVVRMALLRRPEPEDEPVVEITGDVTLGAEPGDPRAWFVLKRIEEGVAEALATFEPYIV